MIVSAAVSNVNIFGVGCMQQFWGISGIVESKSKLVWPGVPYVYFLKIVWYSLWLGLRE